MRRHRGRCGEPEISARRIGNIESYVQCVYGYDIRTEIVGSKGSILVGSLHKTLRLSYKQSWRNSNSGKPFPHPVSRCLSRRSKRFCRQYDERQGASGYRRGRFESAGDCGGRGKFAPAIETLQSHVGGCGGMMSRATGVIYKSPLHEMTQTRLPACGMIPRRFRN